MTAVYQDTLTSVTLDVQVCLAHKVHVGEAEHCWLELVCLELQIHRTVCVVPNLSVLCCMSRAQHKGP